MTADEFVHTDEGGTHIYRWNTPTGPVEIQFDALVKRRDSWVAEVAAYTVRPQGRGILHRSDLWLGNPSGRRAWASEVSVRKRKIRWKDFLEVAIYDVLEIMKEGLPPKPLLEFDTTRPRYFLRPYVDYSGPTILFGPGGSQKSYLALGMAVTACTGTSIVGVAEAEPCNVLLCDWEFDGSAHARRLKAILAGHDVALGHHTVIYRRMTASLVELEQRVRRWISQHSIGFVICDSLGMARGGEPNEAGTAIACMQSLGRLGVPTLAIDHVSKSAMTQGRETSNHVSPIGSIFTENYARNTWSVTRDSDEQSSLVGVGLVHEKTNAGRREGRHGILVKFSGDEYGYADGVRFTQTDLSAIPGMEGKATLVDLIVYDLEKCAPTSLNDICERLDKPRSTVSATLTRLKTSNKAVHLDDNRWGLPA